MNLDDYKPIPVSRFLGQVDYQDATKVINGCAVKAQNMRYTADAAGTRFGRLTTMSRQQSASSATGLDVLEVEGSVNPGQIPVVFDDLGELLQESPAGSGTLVPVATPIGVPAGARMQTTQPPNSLIMAFTDGEDGLVPPLQLYGPTGNVDTVSQNRPGMPWTPGTYVQIGDLVRATDGRWWRCTLGGLMGVTEPTWPGDGYFVGGASVSNTGTLTGASASAVTIKTSASLAFTPPSGVGPWYVIITKVVGGKEVNETAVFGPFPVSKTSQIFFFGYPVKGSYTIYTYNTIKVVIPADPGNSYNVYLGKSPSQFTLKETIVATAATQTISLMDYSGFSGASNPQISAPTQSSASAVWTAAAVTAADGTQWEEWTPACTDVLPAPQAAVVVAGAGSIAAGQDVYIRLAFTSLAEGQWSDPAILSNTGASAGVQVNFDNTGTGGPRIPTWLSMLLRRPDLFFGVNYNLYAAAVAHGAAAPTQYGLVGTFGLGQTVLVQTIPAANVTPPTTQRLGQIALVSDYASEPSGLPNYFAGETGIRYVALLRKSRTASPTAIEPAAVFPAQFNNAGAQPIMFFPPPGPQIGESIAALTVVGGSQAGPFTYIQDQDPSDPPSTAITALSRTTNTVSAVVKDISGIEAGQVIEVRDTTAADLVAGGPSSFLGDFVIATVNIQTRTITWAQTAADATVAQALLSGATLSVQPTLPTVADASTLAVPLNFDDQFLETSTDVTAQLTALVAPNASDAYYVPSLRMVAYIDNNTYPGSFLFSNADDPANITGDSQDPNNPGSGILSIEDGPSRPAICVREMADGEVLALKSNGGYRLNPSANYPSQWNSVRKWAKYGPVCAESVATGKDFLAFWDEETGPHSYIQGMGLEWIGKELQTTLKRVNKAAVNTIWSAVDETQYELKFGVPLDGATTPNYELACNYIEGWGFPEVLNRYGKLIANRGARRWSINPLSARTAKAVKRSLTAGQVNTPSSYPITDILRTNGFVTASFAANGAPPVQVGQQISVTVPGDASFNGTQRIVAAGPDALQWLQNVVAEYAVTNVSWAPDGLGNTVFTFTCTGAVPTSTNVFVDDANFVTLLGYGEAGYGKPEPYGGATRFTATNIVAANGSFTFQVTVPGVLAPTSGSESPVSETATFFNPPADSDGGPGTATLLSSVPSVPSDERIATHQFLYGLTATAQPFSSYSIVTITRTNGVVTVQLAAGTSITGQLSSVVIAGAMDPSFNGTFSGASWYETAAGVYIVYKQAGLDAISAGGTASTTQAQLTVTMVVPDTYNDDGRGIPCQYQPWFFQNLPDILAFGGFRGQMKGNGRILLQPLTPKESKFKPHNILLNGSGVAQQFERGLRIEDEQASILINNQAQPDSWFELHEFAMYASPKFSGRRTN